MSQSPRFKAGDVITVGEGRTEFFVFGIDGKSYIVRSEDGRRTLWSIKVADDLYEHVEVVNSPLYKILSED